MLKKVKCLKKEVKCLKVKKMLIVYKCCLNILVFVFY